MFKEIQKTIDHYGMFSGHDKVLAAVSGGPDSMAMLAVLKRWQAVLGLTIIVASFDHGVRKDSAADVRFVRDKARKLGFSFLAGKRRRNKSEKLSEEILREARYDFLLKSAKKAGVDCLVLGHTLDDQAETVLMRLIRGSGLWGLSAILPVRKLEGVKIVRPLINVTRKQVLDFLKKEKIAFRTDETNDQDIFLRNKVRRKLLPFLEKEFNPNIRQCLSSVALSVGADYAHLCEESSQFIKEHSLRQGESMRLCQKALKGLDISLRRMVFRSVYSILSQAVLSFNHMEELEELLGKRKAGSQVHLPAGWTAVKKKTELIFCRRSF